MNLHTIISRAAIFAAATVTILFSPAPVSAAAADARVTQDFDANWLFSQGDFASAMMPAFDDRGWRQLNVPHDWR
jgi:beta-galactosidase